ncbi:Histone-lysine N-methyltransferase SETMAR [Dufourea novaeangliae]|uniref:Histone-lysine N-methyltransferase SETMAR n=1 Tax=Dufourea novaeangliae TaxID=178035 RepID=A0A154PPX0_DUFNO|nr:Histone-lysine N-methyltransferase SETMAR [Dufourea novaeangliae]
MVKFTNEQRLEIIKTYYRNSESVVATLRALTPIFGRNNRPTRQAVRAMVNKFESTYSLLNTPVPVRQRTGRSIENIAAVRASVQNEPNQSIPRRSQELGICQTTLWRILLKDLHLHPYKIKLTQELKPLDHLKRRNFSDFVLQKFEENPEFHQKIIFSDEAHFWLNGFVNKQNMRYWTATNPHVLHETPLHPQTKNVHKIDLKDRKMKLREIADTLKISEGSVFTILHENLGMRKLLSKWVPRLLTPDQKQQRSLKTMVKLDELRFELLPHPPYSPDLAPSDYWLFADMKKMLQGKKFGSNEEVIAETEAYFESKDKSFYIKGIERLEERWNECITLEGEYWQLMGLQEADPDQCGLLYFESCERKGFSRGVAAAYALTPNSVGGCGVEPCSRMGMVLARERDGKWYTTEVRKEMRSLCVGLGAWEERLGRLGWHPRKERMDDVRVELLKGWGMRESVIVGRVVGRLVPVARVTPQPVSGPGLLPPADDFWDVDRVPVQVRGALKRDVLEEGKEGKWMHKGAGELAHELRRRMSRRVYSGYMAGE